MTATKHTPGPWQVASYLDSGKPSLNVAATLDGSHWEVAQAIGWRGDNADEAGANARLIASAPDLLAALQSIMEWTDTPSEQMPIERRELMIRNAARAAIAKAL